MTKVAVVGGGVGGLATAALLAKDGHQVDLFERRELGGKLADRAVEGFHFDLGPSLLTLPNAFDGLVDDIPMTRLATPFSYRYGDGSQFTVHDDEDATHAAVEAFSPGAGAEWDSLLHRSKRVWEVAERTFFAGPMESPLGLAARMRFPLDLLAIDPLRTLAGRADRVFSDERLRMWLRRYATYSGSSPWLAPATLGCIPWVEQRYGCWHVDGGMTGLVDALVRTVQRHGGQLHVGTEVKRVRHEAGRVAGVELAEGTTIPAEIVVSNADAEHLYRDLMPDAGRLNRVMQAGRSSSGFALLLGLRGRTAGLTHHNIWFSTDQRAEFDAIFHGAGVAPDPTIYVCCSAVTDSSQAPEGKENWFVLVNVREGASTDWRAYGDRLIDRLGVRDRVEVREELTPDDFAERCRAPGGAIYGSSSNGRRSAFLRASNRGPLAGLYLVGGSSHPGGGLPLVARSARIVADMVGNDLATGQLS